MFSCCVTLHKSISVFNFSLAICHLASIPHKWYQLSHPLMTYEHRNGNGEFVLNGIYHFLNRRLDVEKRVQFCFLLAPTLLPLRQPIIMPRARPYSCPPHCDNLHQVGRVIRAFPSCLATNLGVRDSFLLKLRCRLLVVAVTLFLWQGTPPFYCVYVTCYLPR